MKRPIKVHYNSPVILTFTAISLAALIRYYRTHEVTDAPGNAAFLREHGLPEILANTALWGADLSDLLEPLEEAYGIEDIREAIAWSLC